MNLDIDIGNTRVKWRFGAAENYQYGAFARSEGWQLPDVTPHMVRVASVAGKGVEAELASAVSERWRQQPWFARTAQTCRGLRNSYSEPTKMGVDRWLAMVAAWDLVGGAVCVVDVGSALTIDLVSDSGQHLGGYIIPGIQRMQAALFSGTDRVRFTPVDTPELEPGRSTDTAVAHGCLLALTGAVNQVVSGLEPGTPVLLCGGDAELVRDALDVDTRLTPDLVFDGLALAAEEG